MTTTFTPVKVDIRKKLDLRAGDTVRVWQKIQEKGKTRLQAFEGMVLSRKHGKEPGATFTVRRNTGGYGVEKIFPLYSPMIDKIEVTKRSKVRRSKLYFVRRKALKEIKKRLKMMFVDIKTDDEKEEENPEVAEGNAENTPAENTSEENKMDGEEKEEKKPAEEIKEEESAKEEPAKEEEKKEE